MQINFTADNAFTRRHARLIWQQFFPAYVTSVRLRWLLLIFLVFLLYEIISFLFTADTVDWLMNWGLPEGFAVWPWAPLALMLGFLALELLGEMAVRRLNRRASQQFAAIAPPEPATLTLTQADVTMVSPSATVTVPLAKITGLALNDKALAIGFSGAGMVLPRAIFAGPTEENAFLRGLGRGMTQEALQRSSPAVKALL